MILLHERARMRKVAIVAVVIILSFLCLSQPLALPPFPQSTVAYASPEMTPSDGDAWTESNNATYPWTIHSSYPDVIEFTTENAFAGSYSLKVNHTSPTTSMYFHLDLGSAQDLSGYEAISFWLYLWGERSTGFTIFTSDRSFTGHRFRYRISGFDNATWIRVVVPLNAFFFATGSPSWSKIQYIEFFDGARIAEDRTTYYVDGLHFTDFETPMVDGSIDDSFLPNFFFSVPEYLEKRVIYGNVAYTSFHGFTYTSTGTPDNPNLEPSESKSLGQALFALAIAYGITRSSYLKTRIETYTAWINELRSPTLYKGVRNYFNNGSAKNFYTQADTIPNGWTLGGLSYMYSFTGDAIYRNIADDIRMMLVEQVWNSTNNWFDYSIDTQTGAIKYAGSWSNDEQGSAIVGLSAYYRFVSADETVKDRVNKCLTQQLTKSFSYAHEAFTTLEFERDSYMHWGYYEAYKAFNNSTYWRYAFAQAETNLAYNMIYSNGSMGRKNSFVPVNQDPQYSYLDEWGAANSLLLLLFLHQETGDARVLLSFRKTMFDHIAQVKSSLWLVSRYRNARGVNEQYNTKSWSPAQVFIYASLVKYYYEIDKPLRPYPITTTNEVKTVQFVPLWSSIIEVFGDGTNTTVEICVPYDSSIDRPYPNDYWQHYISESAQWGSNWNSSNRILTVWAVCDGTYRIVIETEHISPVVWNVVTLPEHPEYRDRVTVVANITDERSGVRTAILSYNQSDTWANLTMLPAGHLYNATIRTFSYGTSVLYKIYFSDNAANWNETQTLSYTVGDGTPPTISFPPLLVRKLSSYSEITIRTTVSEPFAASGVENATLWYSVDFGEWVPQELSLRAEYASFILQLQEGVKNVQYYAEAYDKAGNKAVSEIYSYIPSEELLILGLPAIWFVSLVIVAVGSVGLFVYFFKVRKTKRAQPQTEEPADTAQT